jgi:biotin synthase
MVLKAGANGIISGGYLTTGGNRIEEDLSMVKSVGLKTKQA